MSGDSTTGRKSGRPRGYIQNYRPQQKTVDLVADVRAVLEEYGDHWPLSVRQVFYRLIGARGYPKTEAFYKKLCHHMANARRGRWIPFDAIRDDGVSTVRLDHFNDEDDFKGYVRRLGERYVKNKLAGQNVHIEVWCEASGMLPQLAAVAEEFSVQVYSCSGFDSLTAKKGLADRICETGKRAAILHLGDCDPSGESIFLTTREDVAAFVRADRPWATVEVDFKRVALTREQVGIYDLPTAPAKKTDSRSKAWSGETCQLEALPPDAIASLLREAIEAEINADRHFEDCAAEVVERRRIALALPAPGGAP